ncbi:hypothetical protein QA584_03380 [Anaerocolumna sp. AGMB13025]|uniref:hypothetical protein n=1 Tax=Anaerocolumna sp. AGMB13025 TaxID=3039116 RepID=UPI00241D9A47|nr:hypothetical protein [Anaerocolumna sp. AGMB13025]WFR58120.1 hypothetical protein QA584_03380 [Anaerocolumna sp. AGMB13025]
MKKYINNEYEFSLEYPEKWECIENYADSIVAIVCREHEFLINKDIIPNLNIFIYSDNRSLDLKLLVHNTKTELSRYLNDFVINEDIIINEREEKLLYNGKFNNNHLSFMQYLIIHNNKVYSITAGCNEEEFEKFQSVFLLIKDSICLL